MSDPTLPYETTPDEGGDFAHVMKWNVPEVHLSVKKRGERQDYVRANAIVQPDEALPLAQAILAAAGIEADVVERVEDDAAGLSRFVRGTSPFWTPDDYRALAALALARARAIEAEPEPDPAEVDAMRKDLADALGIAPGQVMPDRDCARLLVHKWQPRERQAGHGR